MVNTALFDAYQTLHSVYRDSAYSTIELNKTLNCSWQDDKALITKLVYGVLENDIKLNYIINKYVAKCKPSVLIVLKLGVYSFLELSTPIYAVVNDCVNLVKQLGKGALSGFVNATLKAISRDLQSDSIVYPTNKIDYLSVFYSLPKWAVEMIIKLYGVDKTIEILSFKPDYNFTHIRVNTKLITISKFVDNLVCKGIEYKQSVLPDALYVSGKMLSLIDSSHYTIQSLGSMLVCLAMNVKDNASVLDLCAAPGGKSIYLASLGNNIKVTSCDYLPHRVALIDSYAKRLNVKLTTELNDATVVNGQWLDGFDYVLCDVPCSGFGVFYSKPDIKLFRNKQDIEQLSQLQSQILNISSKYVKVGGTLLYSTCTILREENQDVVNGFLENCDNFEFFDINIPTSRESNLIQLLPNEVNDEGFFIAKLKRTK